jgi:hypothetical protein
MGYGNLNMGNVKWEIEKWEMGNEKWEMGNKR